MPITLYNLATIEVFGLAPALVIADHAVKAAQVRIVDVEGNTGQQCVVKFVGDAANVARALEAAEEVAQQMHAQYDAALLLNYEDDHRARMVESPQEYSSITEGYLHLLPRGDADDETSADAGDTVMAESKKLQALGLLETQGLTGVIEGADAMLKAANVEIVGKEKIGAAHVTVMIRGDVAAVNAAIEAGKEAAGRVGKLVAAHVIARPHEGLAKLLPE